MGAIPEVLSRIDQSLLFKDTKPISMTQGILDFLSSSYKEKYYPQRLRDYVKENYSWEKMTSQVEDLFTVVTN